MAGLPAGQGQLWEARPSPQPRPSPSPRASHFSRGVSGPLPSRGSLALQEVVRALSWASFPEPRFYSLPSALKPLSERLWETAQPSL